VTCSTIQRITILKRMHCYFAMATHSIFTLTVPHVSQQCILINMFSVLCYDTQKKELLCFHREAFNTYTVNRNVHT